MTPINPQDVTIVVQGPLCSENSEISTRESIDELRLHFPGATIIVSTWVGMDASGLNADKVVLSPDPGPTTVKFNKQNQPHTCNVNRQITSTLAGLREVRTKYAMKLRSDNRLLKSDVLKISEAYPKRSQNNKLLKQRVVISNMFGKDFVGGLACPFFTSDFFYFGLTEDLLNIWEIPFYEEYEYNPRYSGKRQHSNFPWPQLHIEQFLFTSFVRKHIDVFMRHKFDNSSGQRELANSIIANNFVIADRTSLGLVVPSRLDQNEGFPYENYSELRFAQLYKQYIDPSHSAAGVGLFALKSTGAKLLMFVLEGLKQKARLFFCRIG